MSINLELFLSTNDVSRLSKVDKDVVRRHIRLGRLETKQFNKRGAHMIEPSEFRRWMLEVVKLDSSSIEDIFSKITLTT